MEEEAQEEQPPETGQVAQKGPPKDVLQELISVCREKLVESDSDKERRYQDLDSLLNQINEVCPKYLTSKSYRLLIQSFLDMIVAENDKVRLYRHYKDLIIELRHDLKTKKIKERQRKEKLAEKEEERKRKLLQGQGQGQSSSQGKDEVKMSKMKKKREEAKRKKSIKDTKKLILRLNRRLAKLQAKPLSLDDMDSENSAFIKECKIQKQIVKLHAKVCEWEGAQAKTGREFDKRIKYMGSPYEDINDAVSRKVNTVLNLKYDARRSLTPVHATPDYGDIQEAVMSAPSSSHLSVVEQELLCKKIFQEIGNEIKKRRFLECEETFDNYLQDDNLKIEGEQPLDPDDPSLVEKLKQSELEGQKSIQEVIDRYAAIAPENGTAEAPAEDEDDEEEEDEEADTDIMLTEKENDEEEEEEEDEDEEEDDEEMDEEEVENAEEEKEGNENGKDVVTETEEANESVVIEEGSVNGNVKGDKVEDEDQEEKEDEVVGKTVDAENKGSKEEFEVIDLSSDSG